MNAKNQSIISFMKAIVNSEEPLTDNECDVFFLTLKSMMDAPNE